MAFALQEVIASAAGWRVTKDSLFTRILDEIEATGRRVAMASATFHLVEMPPVTVRLPDAIPALKGAPGT